MASLSLLILPSLALARPSAVLDAADFSSCDMRVFQVAAQRSCADLETRDEQGRTLLEAAAAHGCLEIVEGLLGRGARVRPEALAEAIDQIDATKFGRRRDAAVLAAILAYGPDLRQGVGLRQAWSETGDVVIEGSEIEVRNRTDRALDVRVHVWTEDRFSNAVIHGEEDVNLRVDAYGRASQAGLVETDVRTSETVCPAGVDCSRPGDLRNTDSYGRVVVSESHVVSVGVVTRAEVSECRVALDRFSASLPSPGQAKAAKYQGTRRLRVKLVEDIGRCSNVLGGGGGVG